MLKLYNASGGFVRMISDTDYTDLSIVSTLKDGDKQLSFTYLRKPTTIKNEYYIVTDTDRFVVKEMRPGDHSTQVVCKLDLEILEKDRFQQFTASKKTVKDMAALALVGTGWTVSCTMTKKRSVQCYKKTPLEILYKIRDAFMCELSFDTVNKVVTFANKLGSDKGVYFRADLNLRSLSPTYDSYDYYTRLIPIGADGLTIESVNSGKNYVENTSYSSKVRTLIWEDTSYDDATELKTDAIGKLSDMAAPKRSYSAQIIDFSRLRNEKKLSFSLGDTILITDETTGVMEKQRIVKITEYPDQAEKNSVELSNTTLTWEEMQARYQAAAQAWEDVSNPDGSVNGVYVHGVQAGDVVGVEVVEGGTATTTTLNGAISVVQGQVNATVSDLQAATARIGTVETTYLKATMANLDTANITTARIKDLFVQVGFIRQAQVVGAKITGYLDAVLINAANITAGTLTTDRLVIRGQDKSIVYQINNIDGHKQALTSQTINGEAVTPRTITADRIVAGSITANEIAATTITADKLKVTSLSAITANMGSITAGEIRVESFIGNDRYIGILRTSGGAASAGGGLRMFEITKNDGNDGSTYHSQFYVGTDGYMMAQNANIKGTISATDGDIGGFTISSTQIYRLVNSGGYDYKLTLNAPASITPSSVRGFYIAKRQNDGSTTGSWSYPFRVRYDGSVYCSDLEVANTNFVLNSSSVRMGTSTKNLTISSAGDARFSASSTSYTDIAGGAITATGTLHVGSETSFLDVTGTSGKTAFLFGNNASFQVASGSSDTLSLTANSAGNAGLYDSSTSKWIIRTSGEFSDSNFYLPSSYIVSGSMTFSSAPALRNNIYLRTANTDGTAVPLIGWSSDNALWVGPYQSAVENVPASLNLGAKIANIYCYNASGSKVLLTTAVSDRRLKHDITDLTGARELIMGLSPKSFKLNGEDRERYGFIAQDAKSLVSDTHALIEYNPLSDDGVYDPTDDSTYTYSMDYIQLIAPIVAMIQKHENEISDLKQALRRLTS